MNRERSGIQLKRKDMARMAPGEVGRFNRGDLAVLRWCGSLKLRQLQKAVHDFTTPIACCCSPSRAAAPLICESQWLSDEPINLYMSLLLERDSRLRVLASTAGTGVESRSMGIRSAAPRAMVVVAHPIPCWAPCRTRAGHAATSSILSSPTSCTRTRIRATAR